MRAEQKVLYSCQLSQLIGASQQLVEVRTLPAPAGPMTRTPNLLMVVLYGRLRMAG